MSTIVKTNAPVLLVVGYFRLTGDSSEQYAPRASCFGIMGNSSNDDSTKSAENAQQKAKEYLKTTWARLCESDHLIHLSRELLQRMRAWRLKTQKKD